MQIEYVQQTFVAFTYSIVRKYTHQAIIITAKNREVSTMSRQDVGDEGKTTQIRHPENLVSAEKAIFRKST